MDDVQGSNFGQQSLGFNARGTTVSVGQYTIKGEVVLDHLKNIVRYGASLFS